MSIHFNISKNAIPSNISNPLVENKIGVRSPGQFRFEDLPPLIFRVVSGAAIHEVLS
jgi:hypothetical protein